MSKFAIYCTAVFVILMLVMLLSVALIPEALATRSAVGLNYGHWLVLIDC